ncbi:MAG TPA: hypothetical protein VGZ23_08830 [bacterium]|nr:hypothetical protein [bacterium]
MGYDDTYAHDHIFKDTLRTARDQCWSDGGFVSLEGFMKFNGKIRSLKQVFELFDGLSYGVERLRWDRLVAFHLVLMAFINTFGYDMQRSNQAQFTEIAPKFRHHDVLGSLVIWIPKLGLGQHREVAKITCAAHALGIRPKTFRE